MPGGTGRAIVHVIEPQQIFVHALIDVFMEAGLAVDYVSAEIDPRRTLDDSPDLIFLDADFLPDAFAALRHVRFLAPRAVIASYTSADRFADSAQVEAGADLVIRKSADRRMIVQGLREMEHMRRRRDVDA